MSNKAMSYAIESKIGDPTRKVILMVMADSANTKTGVMWHSVASIAEMAECSPRTVQRHLAVLLESGYVREGDQAHVAHLPARHRPTVYAIAASDATRQTWAGAKSPRRDAASAAGASRLSRGDDLSPVWGDSDDRSEVTDPTDTGANLSPKPEENQKKNQNLSPSELPPEGDRFEDFWTAYAKKVDRGHAVRAWRSAIKKADADFIIRAAREFRQAESRVGTELRFIPNPATWLNGERWTDERPALQIQPGESYTGEGRVMTGAEWDTTERNSAHG